MIIFRVYYNHVLSTLFRFACEHCKLKRYINNLLYFSVCFLLLLVCLFCVVMLAESLEHLELSNVSNDCTSARLNASLITDEHPTIGEILLNVTSLNEQGEAEGESNLNAYKEKLCSHSGHSFYRKSLSKPAYCHHCGEVIWSPLSTGFACDGMLTLLHNPDNYHCCFL